MATILEALVALSCFVLGSLAAKPDLYYYPLSPPSRIVMMTAKVLGADLNIKILNILKKEQLSPEFIKVNPQHTIPTLNDNGFVISESRAIAAYLADSSPNGEEIYPKDIKKRARVEEMLYFDIGRLYSNFIGTYKPVVLDGQRIDGNRLKAFDESMAMLEEYLTRNVWAAGDQMTIADLSLHSTVSTSQAVGYDTTKFPRINNWMERTKAAIPDYQIANQEGLDMWKQMAAAAKG
ncbi:glutathione S-transferase [Nesidiocoris tenuis]|uniref:Glutathione S-transferase n=1 Tax=Nesidiocoris tenuis TaxID=355587 RepID=A0ABN7AU91_9HEMI|nr:glutathione S-transferase [Nesidiocoris tenuis]